ncbi:tyrosine-protein kinase transmembrane receptor Ror2-like [Branchiostoma lanceolatum]|uniref:tyrosine-protein kinase transmembrane receptor Ror2-like n=1 Tax=Branchiostoma lanceolatum TaxID=7740 RepID=UPI001132B940
MLYPLLGRSAKAEPPKATKGTKSYVYMFVGGPQFHNAAYRDQNALQTTIDPLVKSLDETGCPVNPGGADYRGNISVTKSGKICQRWDVDSPHNRTYRPEMHPELVENYCRNPDEHEPGLWCYTTDPSTRWGYCVDPACPIGIAKKWRADGRCGMDFPAAEATPGECNPYSSLPCCSAFGWCGNGAGHCSCLTCVDYGVKA